MTPGLLPAVLALALGGVDASAGFGYRPDPSGGTAAALFTLMAAVVAAVAAFAAVRSTGRAALPLAVLLTAGTYATPVGCHRGGPVGAGLAGLVLVALVLTAHADVRRYRRLSNLGTGWGWGSVAAVGAAAVVMDLVVALLGRGAPARGTLSPWAVGVGCVATLAFVAGCAALVDGVRPPGGGRAHD